MEDTESANPVTTPPPPEKPELGFPESDPDPPPSDPDQAPKPEAEEDDDHGHLREELRKKLDLEEPEEEEGEKRFNASHGGGERVEEEEFRSGESDGEEVRNGEEGDQNDDVANGNVEGKNERSHVSNGNARHQYPVRPEAEDCAFYMKTGTCKFGSNCKFNHPVRRKTQAVKEKVKEKEEAVEKAGQTECKYYLRTGGCKYGKACRFNHSRAKPPLLPAKTPVLPILELNFLGLPIRPGEKECPYYMRNGSCKYGSNCKFNHPDPTAAGGSDPPLTFGNGGSASIQGSSQTSAASWSSPGALNEPAPFVPIMFSPTQGVPTQSPEWNGYQAPLYPPERSMPPPPAFMINNKITQANAFAHQHQQILVDEFPERPGQPDCSYFMKTGDCKFKSNCKYHHPKNRISKTSLCPLSDKGLPLRPDQNICSHYSRYGICKFGPACKFHHPEQPQLSTETTHNDDNPVIKEDGRTAENENNAAVLQPL
ncbi:hypothetical protein Tsubulata_030823 [Turnera subulata]|uniref:C3H1-type domain-containing protein n=1 Tax=Turnera subulata TaxID=218843 RepID=A0A9Q0FXZ1_9ROSI|nr:hypothetical protein Tsubulata_030823 [Turnera subulata]